MDVTLFYFLHFFSIFSILGPGGRATLHCGCRRGEEAHRHGIGNGLRGRSQKWQCFHAISRSISVVLLRMAQAPGADHTDASGGFSAKVPPPRELHVSHCFLTSHVHSSALIPLSPESKMSAILLLKAHPRCDLPFTPPRPAICIMFVRLELWLSTAPKTSARQLPPSAQRLRMGRKVLAHPPW